MIVTHRPKGRMCMVCNSKECPKPEEFKNMRPIGVDKDKTVVVKCINFEQSKGEE